MIILPAWSKFILHPLLGGIIGYLTNWVAITLLFKPKNKILGVQGLLQKRKRIIAETAAEVIRQYLLNTAELKKVVDKDKVRDSISKLVDKTIILLPKTLKKMLSKILRELTYFYFFDKNGYMKDEIIELAVSDSDLEKIVIDKIMDYDISEIERIIKKASSTEISFILWSGAALGVLIGIIQALLPMQ